MDIYGKSKEKHMNMSGDLVKIELRQGKYDKKIAYHELCDCTRATQQYTTNSLSCAVLFGKLLEIVL